MLYCTALPSTKNPDVNCASPLQVRKEHPSMSADIAVGLLAGITATFAALKRSGIPKLSAAPQTSAKPTSVPALEPRTITGRNHGTIRRTVMQELDGMGVDQLKERVVKEHLARVRGAQDSRIDMVSLYNESGWPMRTIGKVKSGFSTRRGTPRQALLCPSVRATIEFESWVQPGCLEQLGHFSHVWVVFIFHGNTNAHKQTKLRQKQIGKSQAQRMNVSAKVQPPGAYGQKVGVFATRSPHRPNPIGLSLVRIIGVSRRSRPKGKKGAAAESSDGWSLAGSGPVRLHLAGCDLIEGTPIIDIKPYLGPPLDAPLGAAGGLDGASTAGPDHGASAPAYRVAPWVRSGLQGDAKARGRVVCDVQLPWEGGLEGSAAAPSIELRQAVAVLREAPGYWRGRHHDGLEDWQEAVRELLQLDIRSVWQGRGGAKSDKGKGKGKGAAEEQAGSGTGSSGTGSSGSGSDRYQEYELEYDGVGLFMEFTEAAKRTGGESRPLVRVRQVLPKGLPRSDGAATGGAARGTL